MNFKPYSPDNRQQRILSRRVTIKNCTKYTARGLSQIGEEIKSKKEKVMDTDDTMVITGGKGSGQRGQAEEGRWRLVLKEED